MVFNCRVLPVFMLWWPVDLNSSVVLFFLIHCAESFINRNTHEHGVMLIFVHSMYTVHCTLYIVHCTLYTVAILYNVHCITYIIYSIHYIQCTLYKVHFCNICIIFFCFFSVFLPYILSVLRAWVTTDFTNSQ